MVIGIQQQQSASQMHIMELEKGHIRVIDYNRHHITYNYIFLANLSAGMDYVRWKWRLVEVLSN